MSLEAAKAFMQRRMRGIVPTDSTGPQYHDCESALWIVKDYATAAGYYFTEEEYQAVVTEHVEAELSAGAVVGPSRYLLFRHDLVEGGGDYLIFRRGVKEQGDQMIVGDSFVWLLGGTVR
jgi:hypothetical protein